MPLATSEQLERSFALYFEEMDRCRPLAGWALLHLVVCMPDICTALALGASTAVEYEDWCLRYLQDDRLNQYEWYEIRCKLLHEGSTIPSPRRPEVVVRYPSFRFIAPDSGRHGDIESGQLILDVGVLHQRMVEGMRAWFAAVEAGAAKGAEEVAENLMRLVTVERRPTRDPRTGVLGHSTASTASPTLDSFARLAPHDSWKR